MSWNKVGGNSKSKKKLFLKLKNNTCKKFQDIFSYSIIICITHKPKIEDTALQKKLLQIIFQNNIFWYEMKVVSLPKIFYIIYNVNNIFYMYVDYEDKRNDPFLLFTRGHFKRPNSFVSKIHKLEFYKFCIILYIF